MNGKHHRCIPSPAMPFLVPRNALGIISHAGGCRRNAISFGASYGDAQDPCRGTRSER